MHNKLLLKIRNYIFNYLIKLFYKVINSDEYINYKLRNKTEFYSKLKFCFIGKNVSIAENAIIMNPQYISIGDNFVSMYNLRIEAWDKYREQEFSPEIKIGNNVIVNTDVHIGCINKIIIGNNVLLASRIYISDHSHGQVNNEELNVAPTARKLFSKGPVTIEDNVWVGEGVCIMPGVTIGKNSIVGANAVVSKNVPPNVVVAGIPAKIIKQLID